MESLAADTSISGSSVAVGKDVGGLEGRDACGDIFGDRRGEVGADMREGAHAHDVAVVLRA